MPQLPVYTPLGQPFIELDTVDSTNNYALTQAHAGMAPHGIAFFSHAQSQGKGQRGKAWIAPPGSSVFLSLVIDPSHYHIEHQFHLSACVALGASDAIAESLQIPTSIKWPNDVYWQDRKAGGILIESIVSAGSLQNSAKWKLAIAGIGINVNQAAFPAGLPNPVSLLQISGRETDTISLAKNICACIDMRIRRLIELGITETMDAYNSILYKKGEQVSFKESNRRFSATVLGVTQQGKLVLNHGTEQEYEFGHLQWLSDQKT